MKILILPTLMLALAYISDAQNVNVPDANFKNALISAGVDTNEDGEISYAEAEAIDTLDVSSKSISDMTGIEAFINLVMLNCSDNQLTSLDISNDTVLEYLICMDNQLTSLDVSHNTVLKELHCFFNLLTSLDLSNNTALEYLKCNDNQLTSLNLTGCIALSELLCFWNLLTNLDVSGNTALSNLDCSVNLLDSLNISNNTSLVNVKLSFMETLYEVCVWDLPFPPADVTVDTTGSPNVYFTTDCAATALELDKVTSKLNIHPNPAKEYIIFDVANISSTATVELYDLQGKKVLEQELSEDKRVTISSFPKGTYLYRLHDKGTVYSGKITVE